MYASAFFQGLKYLFFNTALRLHIAALSKVPMGNAGNVENFFHFYNGMEMVLLHFRGSSLQ